MRNKPFPNYPDDTDYTTNANSYYDDLARKQKLIQLLAEKIWAYDERLDQRITDLEEVLSRYLSQWDERIENLDDEVSHIFVTWLNNGTLEQIINHDVLGNKADQVDLDKTNKQLTRVAQSNVVLKPSFFLMDDDGAVGVYTKLKPILDRYGFKGTSALNTKYIDQGNAGYLSWTQIHSLVADGWEFTDHGYSHPNLLLLSESELHTEFQNAKNSFSAQGLETDVLTYPGGGYNQLIVDVASNYYNVGVRDASWRNPYPVPQYGVRRIGVGPWGERNQTTILNMIDQAIANNELVGLMTHINDHTPEDDILLENVLSHIKNKGYTIERFSDAYNKHKNIMTHGAFNVEKDTSNFVVAPDGSFSQTKVFQLEKDEINVQTVPTYFNKKGIYYCDLGFSNADGTPPTLEHPKQEGTLVINAMGTNPLWYFRDFIPQGTNKSYRSHVVEKDNAYVWTDFVALVEEELFDENNITMSGEWINRSAPLIIKHGRVVHMHLVIGGGQKTKDTLVATLTPNIRPVKGVRVNAITVDDSEVVHFEQSFSISTNGVIHITKDLIPAWEYFISVTYVTPF